MTLPDASSLSAFNQFVLENNIETDPDYAIYHHDAAALQQTLTAKPWNQNPSHFKKVKISALALIKMVMHAQTGGNIEIMGLMQGKVMDAFALPVEGTETRVNAAAEGYEYMVEYVMTSPDLSRLENVLGWYHSHPGYGCWLSGIDVATQTLNQEHQEPFVAIVIDPLRTVSVGKVEIGAFRTWPRGYVAPERERGFQTIPVEKADDYGYHAKSYYELEVSIFKSSCDQVLLDALWNKYWIKTLSSSPLFTNRDMHLKQLQDLSKKCAHTTTAIQSAGKLGGYFDKEKAQDNPISQLTHDATKFKEELRNGGLNEKIKENLFNRPRCACGDHEML